MQNGGLIRHRRPDRGGLKDHDRLHSDFRRKRTSEYIGFVGGSFWGRASAWDEGLIKLKLLGVQQENVRNLPGYGGREGGGGRTILQT